MNNPFMRSDRPRPMRRAHRGDAHDLSGYAAVRLIQKPLPPPAITPVIGSRSRARRSPGRQTRA
jgi:hypothetical protein